MYVHIIICIIYEAFNAMFLSAYSNQITGMKLERQKEREREGEEQRELKRRITNLAVQLADEL